MNILKVGLTIASAALLVAPNSLAAQRGMGGGGRGGRGGAGGNRQGGSGEQQFSSKDLEKGNPIDLLIDKRKDLKLTTPQLEKLANLKDSLKARNDTLYARLDSMSKTMHGSSSGAGDAEAARSARAVFSSDLAEVRDNFDAAATAALAVLDDDQRKPAQELLDKQRKDNQSRRGRGGQ